MDNEPTEPAETIDEPLEEQIAEEPSTAQERPQRSLLGLIGIVVLVVIVVLIASLLKDCAGSGDSPLGGSGRRSIERVPDTDPVAGSVSVWISRETTLKKALAGADVRATDSLSLGEGRYVIQVREGTENSAARALATQQGVFDAGRVYESEPAE